MTLESFRRASSSFDRIGKPIILLITSLISLLGVLSFVAVIRTLPDDRNRLNLYYRTPGCVAGASTSAALSPCTLLLEHLVSKRSVHHTKNADDIYLTLQNGPAVPQEVQIIDYDFWFKVPAGTLVTTKTWHGNIVAVDAPGHETMTSDNPVYINSEDRQSAWGIGGCTLLFTLLNIIGWRSVSRKTVKQNEAL